MDPEKEQYICLQCGFCCDGTLFRSVELAPGENDPVHKGGGSGGIETEASRRFYQPCPHFDGECSIYCMRPDACSSYRCQLLIDLAGGKTTAGEALAVIKEVRAMIGEIMDEYRRTTGNSYEEGFRKMLTELRRMQKDLPEGETAGPEYDLLQARCNIFEALLIKHFLSSEQFEKLVMR